MALRTLRVAVISAAFLLGTATAQAETIDFEDLPAANDPAATISDEYADIGVVFNTTDDGATWSGMSDGDPGGFGIDGSAGPTFLGFDGTSYAFAAIFDTPVPELQLDVTRAAGGTPYANYDRFTIVGFRDGMLVDRRSVYLGAVGAWQTVGLGEEVDWVIAYGLGLPGFRFGVDNIRWQGGEEPPLAVRLDILPGSDRNPIKLSRRGVIPAVLYGSEEFDVERVDLATLGFGPADAPIAHDRGPHPVDHDGDGWLDWVLHWRVDEAGLLPEDAEACVYGTTLDGRDFEGCDVVHPVGHPAR